MSKGLSKAIMTRSRLKNKFNSQKTKAKWKAYTLQRNKCVQLRKKARKITFQKVWILVISPIRHFGKLSDLLSVTKVVMTTMISSEIIKDNREASEILNNFYVNIVEQTTGMKPFQDSFSKTDSVDEQLYIIIENCKVHLSILKIKDNNPFLGHFSLSCATEDMILRILLSLNITKGAGYDTLPPKVIRLVSTVITSPLTGINSLCSCF